MQPNPARHWLRTLLPAGASCPAAEMAVEPGRTMLQQFVTTYTAGLAATLAFIA
ncbi:hypothetical protein [Croceibacterium ferulae]|uniref:hypothetical protein n=1 Tax=Croceibacterium ferulae TaxID=1854641 RepID=UPI0012D817F0|nr:hypothetical protein [Croceibacterium ferulae]